MTGPDPAARAAPEVPQWPSWLPADGSSGVPHFKPGTSEECPYLAMAHCGKCGWFDTDEKRVKAAADLLERVRPTVAAAGLTEQQKKWKAAQSAHRAKQRRGRVKRPGPQVSGFVIRFPRKGGEKQ